MFMSARAFVETHNRSPHLRFARLGGPHSHSFILLHSKDEACFGLTCPQAPILWAFHGARPCSP